MEHSRHSLRVIGDLTLVTGEPSRPWCEDNVGGSQMKGKTGMEVWKTPRTPCETARCATIRISEDAASPRPSSSITFASRKDSGTGP